MQLNPETTRLLIVAQDPQEAKAIDARLGGEVLTPDMAIDDLDEMIDLAISLARKLKHRRRLVAVLSEALADIAGVDE